jgi:hypothetical protein
MTWKHSPPSTESRENYKFSRVTEKKRYCIQTQTYVETQYTGQVYLEQTMGIRNSVLSSHTAGLFIYRRCRTWFISTNDQTLLPLLQDYDEMHSQGNSQFTLIRKSNDSMGQYTCKCPTLTFCMHSTNSFVCVVFVSLLLPRPKCLTKLGSGIGSCPGRVRGS